MVYLGANSSNEITGSLILPKNGANGQPHPAPRPALQLTNRSRPGESATSGEENDTEEREGRIRVGKDYQASTPNFIPVNQRKPEQTPERALLVWSPADHISNAKLDEYIQISKEKYGYNAEQALGMLFWHKHDLDRAIQDLANFTPFPDEWTVEDKVLFEQAFQFHSKSFHRIRQMLPDKTIAQLVKYYYSWKKTRTRTSLMDRQARKLQEQREEKGHYGEDIHDDSESEAAMSETNNDTEAKGIRDEDRKPKCFNCGILCHVTHTTPKGEMCGTCHQYFSKTGNVRPTTAPIRKDGTKSKHALFKNKNQPPKGMYVNHDDLVALATGPPSQGNALLKSMDREIVSYMRAVQNNKQYLSSMQEKARDRSHLEPYRREEVTNGGGNSKINARWTADELLLGVQGIRMFGKNFKVIADVLGTKTESHVRNFFVTYRRRYNLDTVLKEYEAEHGPASNEEDDTKLNEDEKVEDKSEEANGVEKRSNGQNKK